MASSSELGCVYAALILQDDNVEITGEKITKLLNAAKVQFEGFWPGLFARSLKNCDVKALISNVGSSAGAAPAAGAAAAPAAGAAAPAAGAKAAAPAKKEEPEEEEADMGFDLFG